VGPPVSLTATCTLGCLAVQLAGRLHAACFAVQYLTLALRTCHAPAACLSGTHPLSYLFQIFPPTAAKRAAHFAWTPRCRALPCFALTCLPCFALLLAWPQRCCPFGLHDACLPFAAATPCLAVVPLLASRAVLLLCYLLAAAAAGCAAATARLRAMAACAAARLLYRCRQSAPRSPWPSRWQSSSPRLHRRRDATGPAAVPSRRPP
jgi:hypothetical protein